MICEQWVTAVQAHMYLPLDMRINCYLYLDHEETQEISPIPVALAAILFQPQSEK